VIANTPVADPGGRRGAGPPLFLTKLRPEGLKKNFGRLVSPLSKGLDDRPPLSGINLDTCVNSLHE